MRSGSFLLRFTPVARHLASAAARSTRWQDFGSGARRKFNELNFFCCEIHYNVNLSEMRNPNVYSKSTLL